MVRIFWNFPINKLLLVREFPDSEILFKSVVFIWNKWLQIAPLLIIFVDILPKVGAVSFAEFFYQEPCCCCPSIILSNKLNLCKESRNDSLEQAVRAMAAKDWIVNKNVIQIHGYFLETIAKAIENYNSIIIVQFPISWNNYIRKIW